MIGKPSAPARFLVLTVGVENRQKSGVAADPGSAFRKGTPP
jgi:hypothetical protein